MIEKEGNYVRLDLKQRHSFWNVFYASTIKFVVIKQVLLFD